MEDSPTTRLYIEKVLARFDDLEVLESATDGAEAIDKAVALQPDVILTDLHLPRLDGVEAIKQIMATSPCPIIVLSGELGSDDSDLTFAALEAGAVKVMAKPRGMTTEARHGFGNKLANTLRIMSQVQVVTRRFSPRPDDEANTRSSSRPEHSAGLEEETDLQFGASSAHRRLEVIAIGASTGGPAVLNEILTALPAPSPVPILISQHIANGFEHGLCKWLRHTGHDVQIPIPGLEIEPGKVYLSPANASITLGTRRLEIAPPVGDEITPNIDRLFSSIARSYGRRAIGVLLTGMGSDGARGLADLADAGGVTIAQEPETAAIDSMPSAAIDAGAAGEILTVADIPDRLHELTGEAKPEPTGSR